MEKPPYHPDQFHHWTPIHVRFRDLDPLNHVNNSVFNTYFEEARVHFIREVPEFKHSMDTGHSFVLVQIELNYLKPVLYEEEILIGSSVAEFGNSSIKGFQAIYSAAQHELKAVAETTGVWYNLNNNRPARLPEIKNREQYLYKKIDG